MIPLWKRWIAWNWWCHVLLSYFFLFVRSITQRHHASQQISLYPGKKDQNFSRHFLAQNRVFFPLHLWSFLNGGGGGALQMAENSENSILGAFIQTHRWRDCVRDIGGLFWDGDCLIFSFLLESLLLLRSHISRRADPVKPLWSFQTNDFFSRSHC